MSTRRCGSKGAGSLRSNSIQHRSKQQSTFKPAKEEESWEEAEVRIRNQTNQNEITARQGSN